MVDQSPQASVSTRLPPSRGQRLLSYLKLHGLKQSRYQKLPPCSMSMFSLSHMIANPLSRFSRLRLAFMPLRAKIRNAAFDGPRTVSGHQLDSATSFQLTDSKMSSSPSYPKEQPGDDPDDVLFSSIYGARTIELNRPKKLNSLNGSMARKIIPRLKVIQASSRS